MDSTWSVRIPDDLKEKITNIVTESGLNTKDFLANIIQSYELKMAGTEQTLFEPDIDELRSITGRMNSIYVNIFERMGNFQRAKELEFEEKITKKNEMLIVFNTKIKDLETQASAFQSQSDQLKQTKEELKEHNIQLIEMTETGKALISEYREKNETLTGLLGEYKGYKTTVDALKAAIDKEKEQQSELNITLANALKTIDAQKLKLEELQDLHAQEQVRDRELLSIEKDKELLKVRTELQQKMELVQEDYVNKVKELLKTIQDMQQRVPAGSSANKRKSITHENSPI